MYIFKRKQKWKTDYQYIISSTKSSGHHISVSIKGTFWFLSLVFLEVSSFRYFSCYVSLGFTIRTVRTQNNQISNSIISSTLVFLYHSFLARRSTIWPFINFHLFFSLNSRSLFHDSFPSFQPVVNGKLLVKTKTNIELSQLAIVSQNFTSFKL